MNNILIVLSTLGTGGAERVAISYANWLCQNTDVNVHIAFYGGKKNNIYNVNRKIYFHDLECNKKGRIGRIINHIMSLKKLVKEIKPNVIFTMFHITNIYGWLSKSKDIVLISSERANIKMRSKFSQFLYKFAAKKCDGFIFQTERAKLDYPSKVQRKSIVIPNAVSQTIDVTNVGKNKIITGMGRLTYQKGFDTLIKSFSLVLEKHKDYKLSIFGDGEDLNYLIDLSKRLNVCDKVIFNGIRKDALFKISESQMFILSSRFEGMPNALMEAMSIGMPCISTDCDYGPSEIISDGKNGFLVNVDDEIGMANKIIYLIENVKIREKIGNNARKILETNHPDKIYRMYYNYMEDLYKENKVK